MNHMAPLAPPLHILKRHMYMMHKTPCLSAIQDPNMLPEVKVSALVPMCPIAWLDLVTVCCLQSECRPSFLKCLTAWLDQVIVAARVDGKAASSQSIQRFGQHLVSSL